MSLEKTPEYTKYLPRTRPEKMKLPSKLLYFVRDIIFVYSKTAILENRRIQAYFFLGAPTRPEGPLKVKDVTKNGAKLSWDKPEDDGGTPVTAYVVEKMDMSTGRWVPVGRSQKPEMEVKGLQEGHEYKFRVKAVNDEGESEPLETDGTVVAKNPFGNENLV